MPRGAWIKFAALLALLTGMVVAVHIGGGLEVLDFDTLQAAMRRAGPWAPLIYVVVYVVATVATVPGTLLTVLGATLFPLGVAYGLVVVGATIGAAVSFVIGRSLGRDAVEHVLSRAEGDFGERLRAWTARVERNGLLAIAYLRMAYVPFPLLNYAAPLTGVSFRDFTLGTMLGILPGVFVFVFMGNTLRVAWEHGSLEAMPQWQIATAVALFVASLLLPWGLQRRFGAENKPE